MGRKRVKVANYQEAGKLMHDTIIHGCAYVDKDGMRVDPTKVVIMSDGTTALSSGRDVYRPEPWRFD